MYEELIRLNMDGIVFYPFMDDPYDFNCRFHHDYTKEEFKNITSYPKSGWAYYKNIKNSRFFYDSRGEMKKPFFKDKVNSNMNNVKQKLIKEFDEVNSAMSKYIEDAERWSKMMHYREGLRFAIKLIEKEIN